MKLKLLFLSIFLTQIISAQTFTESLVSEFDGITTSSIAFTDVDGDTDPDILITGGNNSGLAISKLYINDGQGNFSEMLETPFDGVEKSSIAFWDVDGDSDPDVLITGAISFSEGISKLYINDGQGNFSEVTGTPFDAVRESSVAFADVDGDNDLDVLITGRTNSDEIISKLYTNDGMGNFSEVTGTPFDGVRVGSIAFTDVDGDTDPDVLITGRTSSLDRISKLYTNDGLGNFSEVIGTPFDGVSQGSIAFSDVDGDSDPDVLITGQNNSVVAISKLYANDGQGSFSEVTGTPFDRVNVSSIAFTDVDGDSDPDVLITGQNNSSDRITKLYTNDGLGNFSEVSGTPFDGVFFSSIAFTDVDGDSDPDVLITGQNSSNERIAKLYTNDLLSSINNLISGSDFKFIPYPNPVVSKHLKVDFNLIESGLVVVKVYGLNGQLLIQQKKFTLGGVETILVNTSSLSAGSYFIQLDNGRKIGVAKFIVP